MISKIHDDSVPIRDGLLRFPEITSDICDSLVPIRDGLLRILYPDPGVQIVGKARMNVCNRLRLLVIISNIRGGLREVPICEVSSDNLRFRISMSVFQPVNMPCGWRKERPRAKPAEGKLVFPLLASLVNFLFFSQPFFSPTIRPVYRTWFPKVSRWLEANIHHWPPTLR